MKVVYIDTSALVAVLFKEKQQKKCSKVLAAASQVVSASLIEAEALSAATRENISLDSIVDALKHVNLLTPQVSLRPYLFEVFSRGYLKGADAFHLACGIWFAGKHRKEILFLTLDDAQNTLAEELGFVTIGGRVRSG